MDRRIIGPGLADSCGNDVDNTDGQRDLGDLVKDGRDARIRGTARPLLVIAKSSLSLEDGRPQGRLARLVEHRLRDRPAGVGKVQVPKPALTFNVDSWFG